MTDPILPVLVLPLDNATAKSIARMRWGERSRRRPFRRDPVSGKLKAGQPVQIDLPVATEAIVVFRAHDIGHPPHVIAVARRAAHHLVRLGGVMVLWLVVAGNALLIERFANRRSACSQRSQMNRIRSQRLQSLMTNLAVVVPAGMSGGQRSRRSLHLSRFSTQENPGDISRSNRRRHRRQKIL